MFKIYILILFFIKKKYLFSKFTLNKILKYQKNLSNYKKFVVKNILFIKFYYNIWQKKINLKIFRKYKKFFIKLKIWGEGTVSYT